MNNAMGPSVTIASCPLHFNRATPPQGGLRGHQDRISSHHYAEKVYGSIAKLRWVSWWCTINFVRWKLVVHVGIDGFIRLIVYCRWSANNKSLTVLNLFKEAEDQYGLPLPVRTDFGMENVTVWECILQRRNSNTVITGSSVHNQRIERLNRDVSDT